MPSTPVSDFVLKMQEQNLLGSIKNTSHLKGFTSVTNFLHQLKLSKNWHFLLKYYNRLFKLHCIIQGMLFLFHALTTTTHCCRMFVFILSKMSFFGIASCQCKRKVGNCGGMLIWELWRQHNSNVDDIPPCVKITTTRTYNHIQI